MKVTLELKGKQVDKLLALALKMDKTIGGTLREMLTEYLGESGEKPVRKAARRVKPLKFDKTKKRRPRRKEWGEDVQRQ